MPPLHLTPEDRALCADLHITPPESDNPLASESIEHAAALMSTPGTFIAIDPNGVETVVVPLQQHADQVEYWQARFDQERARKRAALRTAARYRADLRELRAEVRCWRTREGHARADLRSVLMAALFVVAVIATALLRKP